MEYISTTDLRTKAVVLRDALRKGKSTYIVHRSKVIGIVAPYEESTNTATLQNLSALSETFSAEKSISARQREDQYKKHLESKYGKSIS